MQSVKTSLQAADVRAFKATIPPRVGRAFRQLIRGSALSRSAFADATNEREIDPVH